MIDPRELQNDGDPIREALADDVVRRARAAFDEALRQTDHQDGLIADPVDYALRAALAAVPGYQGGMLRAAEIAEIDCRSPLAMQTGYEPEFHKQGRRIAFAIRAEAASAPQRGEDGWRDIASAPWGASVIVSDGVKVWLSSRHKGLKSNDGMPLDGHDWYLLNDGYPTHWMPLPPAPQVRP